MWKNVLDVGGSTGRGTGDHSPCGGQELQAMSFYIVRQGDKCKITWIEISKTFNCLIRLT